MSQRNELNEKYRKVANLIVNTGMLSFPVTDTLIEILKFYLDEDDLDFIQNFKIKSSLSIDQLVKKSKLPENVVIEKTNKLTKIGLVFDQLSSSGIKNFRLTFDQPNPSRIMVYRLLFLVEYTFMSNIPKDQDFGKYKKLAGLYEKLMDELKDEVQDAYETLLPIFKNSPPLDRIIPIHKNT